MTVTRATLPQEFFDITAAQMLKAPEPQYLYAALWMQAVSGAFDLQSQASAGLGFRSKVGNTGAPLDSFEMNQLMLEPDPVFSDYITAKVAAGSLPGHVVRLNRPIFKNTSYTESAREVTSGSTISTTPIPISASQASLTMRRFAGPYDSDNSRVAPFGLDAFDASMSVHQLAGLVGQHMHRDRTKFLDYVLGVLLDGCSNTVRSSGFSADNDSVVAGDAPMDLDVLKRTNKVLDEANVPRGPDGRRVMVLHPNQIYQLEMDPRWQRIAKEELITNPLLAKSYKGATSDFHIFQSTSLRTTTNGSNITIYKGHAFGPGILGAIVGKLPEVRTSSDDNYEETPKAIWLAYEGFGLLDSSFGAVIRTS